MDFSDNQPELASDKHKERFFAGVPSIPKKDKDGMAVYQLFIQHILYSLAPKGKAAIVVPTGFLTKSGIAKKIREYLVKEKMLRGVISMPADIFANTGTNVSILFVDRENSSGEVVLMDASKLGTKVKLDGKNQKTVLSTEEISRIIDTFTQKGIIQEFSVITTYDAIAQKKYSISPGQFFEAIIEYTEISHEEFTEKMDQYRKTLRELTEKSNVLGSAIDQVLARLSYDI